MLSCQNGRILLKDRDSNSLFTFKVNQDILDQSKGKKL